MAVAARALTMACEDAAQVNLWAFIRAQIGSKMDATLCSWLPRTFHTEQSAPWLGCV